MLPNPDTSEHFPLPHLSHSPTVQYHWWQQPSIRLKRKFSELISSLTAEWGKSQNVPLSVPPTNHWKAQPEARFPEEKKPPWEINAHIKSVSTKLFSVGASVPHNQSCIWGTTTPFFGAHVKNFFLLQIPNGKSVGFLEVTLNCLSASKRMEPWGHRHCPWGEEEKVKSISLMMSICSIKTDNIGFWGRLFEK